MQVITISGKAENGKDLVAKTMKEQLEQYGKRVLIVHYADYLKFICQKYYGWDGNKDAAGRTLLQEIGTDKIRKLNPDFWVNIVVALLGVISDDWDVVLIPDSRFRNEVNRMKDLFSGTLAVWVERPMFQNSLTEEQRQHPSETALDDYDFDWLISNDHYPPTVEVARFIHLFNLV